MVKRLPTMQETRVLSLGQEDPLEKKMATHSSILAWKIPWTEEPGRLQSMGSQRVGHDWATSLSLKDVGIPPFTCLLRNLYTGQEATVRTMYGTTDWFNIEKGVWQGWLLSPCLFDLCAEHIMRKARLDVLQAGLKIGRRNINNLRYADDTTFMAESKEELKSLLM